MRLNIIAFFLSMLLMAVMAQEQPQVLKSNSEIISIRDGENFKRNSWRLAPEAKPDIYSADLINGKTQKVTFISDVDSLSFMVEEGGRYDFFIEWGQKICHTQIIGRRFVPAAVFDEEYQGAFRGKTIIEIPEVYEMVNIVIAMTSFGIKNKNFVYQNSDYYKKVRTWFEPYKEHLLITEIDSVLSNNPGYYGRIKMNGYAFVFAENGTIEQSPVYDRTSFRSERTNFLRPYLDLMQSFAEQSDFRKFYSKNTGTYEDQIIFYRDTVNIAEMKKWLDKNFPGSNRYDCYKIIFSPLVSYNQSSTWFESNGFHELQPHVNFPYRQDLKRLGQLSREAEIIYRGNIVFTEINHGYINPEGEKYAREISDAISNRHKWVDKTKGDNYYRGNATFTEYMNWGLVSLRIIDFVPATEQEKLLKRVENMMVKSRGFIQFTAYNRFLINLYRNREQSITIADLYPQIIEWFNMNN